MNKFSMKKLTDGISDDVMAGVIIRRDTVEGMYHAVVRQQTSHDGYREIYLEAPTEANLRMLLQIHKPFLKEAD